MMTEEEFAEAKATDDKLHHPPILDQEVTAEIHGMLATLFIHKRCPHCSAASTGWKQVGRCVYCGQCQARLYQGRIP